MEYRIDWKQLFAIKRQQLNIGHNSCLPDVLINRLINQEIDHLRRCKLFFLTEEL